MLNDLLKEWQDDGYGEEDVEIWAVGHAATADYVGTFAGDATSTCLLDGTGSEGSAFSNFAAAIDDVYLIDRNGQVRYLLFLNEMPLWDGDSRDDLDGWVRGLLDEPLD